MAFLKGAVIAVITLVLIQLCDSSRILFIAPTPSYSHQIFFRPIVNELLKRGHHVTYLTTDPLKDSTQTNLTEIDVNILYTGSVLKTANKNTWAPQTKLEVYEGEQSRTVLKYEGSGAKFFFKTLLSNPGVQDLINNKDKYHFDIVVLEPLTQIFLPLAHIYNCPSVGVLSIPQGTIHDAEMRSTLPLMYGTALNVPYLHPMSLWEKLENIYYHYVLARFTSRSTPTLDELYKEVYGPETPGYHELTRKMNILLVNSHPALIPAKPNLPGVVSIAGINNPPVKPLPKDMKAFLDSATNGAIYFSLGSNVQSHSIDDITLKVIVETLRDLPYKVLWKWDTETFEGVPPNVMLNKWFPQNDILHHPNIKAFITQGGLQSLEEAIHARVPLIGIPIFGDQHFTVNRIQQLQIGLKQRYVALNQKDFTAAIMDVATNPKYKKNVEKLADIYEDQLVRPVDTAVWWIEHAIRTNGGEYLRNPGLEYSWMEFYMLDLVAILVGIILVVIFVICSILSLLKKVLFSGGKVKSKKE